MGMLYLVRGAINVFLRIPWLHSASRSANEKYVSVHQPGPWNASPAPAKLLAYSKFLSIVIVSDTFVGQILITCGPLKEVLGGALWDCVWISLKFTLTTLGFVLTDTTIMFSQRNAWRITCTCSGNRWTAQPTMFEHSQHTSGLQIRWSRVIVAGKPHWKWFSVIQLCCVISWATSRKTISPCCDANDPRLPLVVFVTN
jgi:hypothetical protein